MCVMGWRAHLEAAVLARGGSSQDDSVAFGTSAPIADAKEADDVLVNPVQECDANPNGNDHNQRAYHDVYHGGLLVPRPVIVTRRSRATPISPAEEIR